MGRSTGWKVGLEAPQYAFSLLSGTQGVLEGWWHWLRLVEMRGRPCTLYVDVELREVNLIESA